LIAAFRLPKLHTDILPCFQRLSADDLSFSPADFHHRHSRLAAAARLPLSFSMMPPAFQRLAAIEIVSRFSFSRHYAGVSP